MRSLKAFFVALLLLAVSGQAAQDGLSQEDVDSIVGVWKAKSSTNLNADAADAAFKKGVEAVGGDPAKYPYEQVNSQAFTGLDPGTDLFIVIAGVDPSSGMFWGYRYSHVVGGEPRFSRHAGVAHKQADGSLAMAFVSSESTATSFRTLKDGKLTIAWLQGVELDDTTADPVDIRVGHFERVEGEQAAGVLNEVAAMLPLEGADN